MSLRRFLPTNRNAEADRSSLENIIYTSNVTTAPTHNLSGLDFVGPPEYSPTDTLGVAEASQLATPNYSKCPFGNITFPPISHLCEFC
jgi:hypothetical protein